MSERSEFFDIDKAFEHFNSSLIDDEDINIGPYLEAYEELGKFCSLLGTVFTFVKTEIVSKSDVMKNLIDNCEEDHFETVKKMIEFEMGSELINKEGYISGSRTFLRLHRGLDFIRLFLREIAEADINCDTSRIGSNTYNTTLGKYHPWPIRKAADIGMKFLPKKRNLITKVCGSNLEEVEKCLPQMLEAADKVYSRTENCYKTYDLLDLP